MALQASAEPRRKPLPAPPPYSESTTTTLPFQGPTHLYESSESIQKQKPLSDENLPPGQFPEWPKEGSQNLHHVEHSAWKVVFGMLDLIMMLLPLAFLGEQERN
jgi:hypothetical protein